MSRIGYWCKECGCFRENAEDMVAGHLLAAKRILCTEGEDPYASGLCIGFATFNEVKRRKQKIQYRIAS